MSFSKITRYLFASVLGFTCQLAFAAGGKVLDRQIYAKSLLQNSIGTNPLRQMTIYLPPGYDTSTQRYPVIYMLPNPFGSYRADFDQHNAAAVFDQAIEKKILPPSIVVTPDLTTPLGPSWYVNSSTTGNWDDFVVKELVPYIDSNFHTLATSSSRAVIGNFIGAYGALRLGMLHPDIFGTVYAMHPVGTGSGVQVFTARPDWKLLENATSLDQVRNAGFSTLFLTMFQAFLPDTAKAPLYADLPASSTVNGVEVNAEQMSKLRSRFFIAELVPQNVEHLRSLRGLKIDWSRNDANEDHIYANQALTHLLNEYGIQHEAEEFNGMGEGDPYWGKSARMLTEVLPFLAANLNVDSN